VTARRQFGRIRKPPSGRWQARYPDGSGQVIAAPTTFGSKADASRFLAQVQADLERGQWRDPRHGQVRFADWAEEWLRSNPSKRATTAARDRIVLETHFVPALGARRIGSITPAHVRAAVEAMAAKLAPATVRTNLGVLRAVFNAAVEADVLGRSPVRGIRVQSAPPSERPLLTPDELMRLADTIEPRYRALVLVAGVLGLRWSEAIGLRVADISFLARTITVTQTISEVAGRLEVSPTKSRSSRRTIAVPAFLLDELSHHLGVHRNRPGVDELAFVGPKGGPLRRSFAARIFTPAVEAAGLDPQLTFHGLRHVATSLMVAAGEHPRVIQQRLGHATAKLSMELYAHVPEAADRDAAARLDAEFRRARGTEGARGGPEVAP
jgi:integrase